MAYEGPLRDEPVAIELHNTLYAAGGERVDGLRDRASAAAFLKAIGPRLVPGPLPEGPWPPMDALTHLRTVVRDALGAAVDGGVPDRETLQLLNAFAAQAPRSPRAEAGPDGVVRAIDHAGADRSAVVLASFAAGAIDLLTGPERDEIHACGAPGCILVYVRDHPRRRWCSNACGNRARQARHYARGKRSSAD